jgi:hypothetical protein
MPLDANVLAYIALRLAIIDAIFPVFPEITPGILASQGNQGSANTAHLAGQAGTGAYEIALPRSLHFGAGGTAQGSSKP